MKNEKVTSFIHRLLVKWDKRGYSPFSINVGNCDEFSYELELEFPDGYAIWGEDYPLLFKTDVDPEGHNFFVLDGTCYDSECPEGVSSPDLLPYYQRAKKALDYIH